MRRLILASLAVMICAAGSAVAAVDVELAFAPDTVAAGDEVRMFSSIANMSDAETTATLEVTITFMGYEVGPLAGDMPLAAGEELSQEFVFIVPPLPMDGTMEITVAATADGVTNTATASLTIVAGTGFGDFGGLNQIGDDLISQISGAPVAQDSPSFGDLKAMFR